MKVGHILVPTDFSETANHAVEQAVELAIHTRARLHLLHVVEPRALPTGAVTVLVDYLRLLESEADQSLALKVEVLRGNGVDVQYSTSRASSPFSGIASKVDELKPDLLVMGTHGRTGLERLLLGSVAEKVLRHVRVNVLTLGNRATIVRSQNTFDRIVVACDFSECSRRAVELAASVLSPGGKLTVVHVVATPIHPSLYAAGVNRLFAMDPELPQRVRASLVDWLSGASWEIARDVEIREGDVFAEILDVARDRKARLLVMGTKGLTGLDHLLLGSVTERVVRSSEIPVLTVH
jgi:nucleotide-binding universal stress UspA family protein